MLTFLKKLRLLVRTTIITSTSFDTYVKSHVKRHGYHWLTSFFWQTYQQHLSRMLFPHPRIATRPFSDTAKIVAYVVVSSRFDHCNALLASMPESNLAKLQRVQNTLARVVTGFRRRGRITSALTERNWLPIRARITFKVASVVYRLRERRQPPCLADLISDYVPMRTLRSSTKTLLLNHP